MPPLLTVSGWLVAGAAAGVAHIALLRRALVWAHAAGDADEAVRRVVRRFPLRLLAVAPVLLVAARSGLWACLALVCGLLIGRLAVIAYLGWRADALTE